MLEKSSLSYCKKSDYTMKSIFLFFLLNKIPILSIYFSWLVQCCEFPKVAPCPRSRRVRFVGETEIVPSPRPLSPFLPPSLFVLKSTAKCHINRHRGQHRISHHRRYCQITLRLFACLLELSPENCNHVVGEFLVSIPIQHLSISLGTFSYWS